jgi:hypothetical protein
MPTFVHACCAEYTLLFFITILYPDGEDIPYCPGSTSMFPSHTRSWLPLSPSMMPPPDVEGPPPRSLFPLHCIGSETVPAEL